MKLDTRMFSFCLFKRYMEGLFGSKNEWEWMLFVGGEQNDHDKDRYTCE